MLSLLPWSIKLLLRSKFTVKFVTKTLCFQLTRSGCTCFGHWNELWRPLSENIELENVGFSRPPLQIYVPVTKLLFWLWRHFLNAPRKQTWTVRKQLAIKASLVFARFGNCEGGNRRLRWLCRTSTDWIWERQILRAANLREGNKTHFTKSYFMQFVPTEIRTTGRCICICTSNNNNNTQARRSRVSTNFTCLLATLECSFIQV